MFAGLQGIHQGEIIIFALVLLRVSAFIVTLPAIGSTQVPAPVKILLSLSLAVVLYPVIKKDQINIQEMDLNLISLLVREVLLGLLMGFLFRFFFFALTIAGEMIGISTGLSSAQLFNPSLGSMTNVFEQFYLALATLLLLTVNGHHLFIQGLAASYDILPLSDLSLKSSGFLGFADLVTATFVMGIKMAAPIIVAVFLANLSMGILGRTVPQINVLMTSLQVTILVSLGVLFMMTPILVDETNIWLGSVAEKFFQVLKVL